MSQETEFYINEKVSVWRRTQYKINAELTKEQIIEVIGTSSELFYVVEVVKSDLLFETENGIPPNKNDDKPTMEVFTMDDELIWSNKSTLK